MHVIFYNLLLLEIKKLASLPESFAEAESRFRFLQQQFQVKASFLSGYQLKQLKEVCIFNSESLKADHFIEGQ